MRLRLGCVALALGGACLVACDAPRPDGAFTPAYQDGQDDGFAMKNGADAAAPDEQSDDTSDDNGDTSGTVGSSGSSGTSKPGTSKPGTSNAGREDAAVPPEATPSQGPLANLEGKYLVRMDNYSSASATKDGTTLLVHNRVSNLFVVTLTAQDDNTLQAHESLCEQAYWNDCEKGCTTRDAWKTTLDTRVPKFFAGRTIDRLYTVDATGKLDAPLSAIALGFDAGEGGLVVDLKAPLPTSKSDSHVWHLNPSDSANPSGVRTEFKINSLKSTLGLTQSVDCIVSSVQVYATKFSAQVDLRSKDALDGKSFPLVTEGSQGLSLDVTSNAPGSSSYCTKANVDGATPADEQSWIRFKRYPGSGVGCPTDFESKFPGITTPTSD